MDNLDNHTEHGLSLFMVTLTSSEGFTDDQCIAVVAYHQLDPFVNCLLVKELHQSGLPHFHAVVDIKLQKANGLTLRYERLYKKLSIPLTKCISIRVKRCVDKIGAFHYLMKELSDTDDPLVLKGWERTWIQDEIRNGLKHMPYKVLLRGTYRVTKSNGTDICLKYADLHNMSILGKDDFADLIAAMVRDKYRFASASLKVIYVELLCELGRPGPLHSLVANEIFNLT